MKIQWKWGENAQNTEKSDEQRRQRERERERKSKKSIQEMNASY